MRLSEAIRLGIGVVRNEKSVFLSVYGYDGQPGICGCAIGTGMYAIGYSSVDALGVQENGVEACKIVWPWTAENNIAGEISFRHFMGKSRESLATWIEQLENERGITDGQAVYPEYMQAEFYYRTTWDGHRSIAGGSAEFLASLSGTLAYGEETSKVPRTARAGARGKV